MDNVSRNMEILRKNQKKILEIKTTITEMKKDFDGLVNGLDTKNIIQLYVIFNKLTLTVKTHTD